MATLFPVICTATVTNASKLVTVTDTDQSTGLPPVLSDLNCRPNGTVFIAGVGYLVGERLSTTTFNLERNYEGANASGLSCTIGVFTPEMANRAELATQLREYSALVALLREDWNGLVYTLISPTGAADPGSGNLAFDNATPASITGMYVDVNDARGRTITGQVMTWRQGTQVRTQSLATGAFVTVELAATPTNNGPDQWISNAGLSLVESYGTLAPGEKVAVIYIPSASGLDPDYTVALLVGRAAYDGAAAGIQALVNDVGDGRAAIYTKLSATSADWSTAAYVTGGVGPQGDKGWSPQLGGVSDGARRVFKLAGYVGGAGTAPTANVGEYLKADGTFTATIGDAVDVRGPSGAAGIAGGGLKGIACRVVITANVNLAGGAIAAGTTHDGVTLDANDLVLVAGQAAPAENGPYPAPAAGAATRHTDFDVWDELVSAYFPVSEGTLYADTLWRNTNAKGGTLGTTALVFEEFASGAGADISNLSLAFSVGSGALTCALKQADGSTDPASGSGAVKAMMRSTTASSGAVAQRSATGPLSLVVSSGSTLGHVANINGVLYWYLIDNFGTLELAVSGKYFGKSGIVSTTAEGGAGAADSGATMYSTTARSNVPFRLIARTLDTQTTAGAWASVPSRVDINPAGPFSASFKATKAGGASHQTGIASATPTKVTFPVEVSDVGGFYDVANSRWYPPSGPIEIDLNAYVTGAFTDGGICGLGVAKNGSLLEWGYVLAPGVAAVGLVSGTFRDIADGDDYYEAYVYMTLSSGTGTVNAATDNTRMVGRSLNLDGD